MKRKEKKTVCYVRSTSIVNDSRASKEILSLINNGFDVIVLGWDRDNRISDYNNIYISNIKIKAKFFKHKSKYGKSINTINGLILFQFWIYNELKSNKQNYDYIHACDFDCGYMAYKIAKKYNKKLVYDMYDYYVDSRDMPRFIKKSIEKKENRIINYADVSIICGEWRKKQIRMTNPKKLIVIHNTPDLQYKCSDKIIKSNSKKIKIAYVGVFQDNRLLLEILEKFKINKDFEFHIGGFGVYEKQIIAAAKNNDNIFYYGSLKYEQVLSLEADCDILFATYNPIIKNHKYSAPNKVYEAMALGKPIIVCKNTGIDELVIKNNTGYAIDYNAEEFVEILNKYKKDRKLLKKISDNAKKMYKEKYSWNLMEKKLISAYNDLEKIGGIND